MRERIDSKGRDIAKEMSNFVNGASSQDNEEFIEFWETEHRTLQSEFTQLCVNWFESLAKRSTYDGRNKWCIDLAKKMKEAKII